MWEEYLERRNHLFFAADPDAFAVEAEKMAKDCADAHSGATREKKGAIENMMAELAKDAASHLPAWTLRRADPRIDATLTDVHREFAGLLGKWGRADKQTETLNDAYAIANSNLRRIAELADRKLLNNRLGNDAAWGLAYAMRRGACFATTNPVMVNAAKNYFPELWAPVRDRLRRDNPGTEIDRLVTLFTIEVVQRNCAELLPIFEATDGRLGHVSMQVNPHNAENADAMREEVEFMYAVLRERLGRKPNVLFKLPAVEASLEAGRSLVAKGFRLTITSNCSVSQHMVFAPIVESGELYSYMVMINGRFDEPVAGELRAAGVTDAEAIAQHAANAVIQRSYELHKRRGFRKSVLLSASMRGAWHVGASLTGDELPVHITCFPDKAKEYDATMERLEPGCPTPPGVLAALRGSEIFRKAYDDDGLRPGEFIVFPPIAAMMNQFRKCYDDTAAFLAQG